MGRYRKSQLVVNLKASPKAVWEKVTNNEEYQWRSDVSKLEVLADGMQWHEYDTNGSCTEFVLTKKETCASYGFMMENKMMTGEWEGTFKALEDGGTRLTMIEMIRMKNPLAHYLSYLIWNLKAVQIIYAQNLKKALGEK